jgi:hypothetical protein
MRKMFVVFVLLSALVVLACLAYPQLSAFSGQRLRVSSSLSNPGTTSTVDRDAQTTPPGPWADIRQFGAFATYSSTTASTTSGRPTVTLASAQSFKNGEYVTVFNAGAVNRISAMGIVKLTPAIEGGGFNTVAAGAGSTTYSYKVVAADRDGGYTAASEAVTTSTGNALGQKLVSISTFNRSGQTVTVKTSAPHPFTVGSQVYIKYWGGNPDNTFWGFFIVKAIPDNLHFTYEQNLDSAGGATTSDTGGTAVAILCNHLKWSAATGAWKYYVYGRTKGAYKLLGVTMEPFFDDYGSPMNDNRSFPPFIPTIAPSVGANDHLTAKILSGGGTTTLTLASSAGVSLSGVGVVSDDGPAMIAASGAGTAAIYVPATGATINSFTELGATVGHRKKLLMQGSIALNDTLSIVNWNLESWGVIDPAAFAWQGVTGLSGSTAYPMVAINGGPNVFRYVEVGCAASNGCLDIYEVPGSGAINTTFEYSVLSTGAGSNSDYLGLHGLFGFGGFSTRFDKVTFLTGTPGVNSISGIGGSFMPSFIFKLSSSNTANAPSGNFSITRSWFQGRSSFEYDLPLNAGGGNYVLMNDIQTQNSFVPILQYTGSSTVAYGAWNLQNITPADFPTAVIANLASNDTPLGGLYVVNASAPNQTGLFTTGGPITGTFIGVGALGLNRDIASPPYFPNEAVVTNNTGSMGYLLPAPTAPRVAVGAHGSCSSNCVVAGTYYYAFAPVDTAGHYGPFSTTSSAATTDGTQTMTISWAPVAGQVLAYVSRSVNPRQYTWRGDSGGAGYAGAGYVDLGGTSYSCSVPCAAGALPNGLASGANSSGLTTQQLTLAGGGFFNRESGTFTANRARTVQDASGTESLTIANGSAKLGTSSISAKSCAGAVTVTAKGVLTTDTLIVTPNGSPALHYASLTLSNSYPTPGGVNILVCNPTSEPLTPGAAMVNWRVVR